MFNGTPFACQCAWEKALTIKLSKMLSTTSFCCSLRAGVQIAPARHALKMSDSNEGSEFKRVKKLRGLLPFPPGLCLICAGRARPRQTKTI